MINAPVPCPSVDLQSVGHWYFRHADRQNAGRSRGPPACPHQSQSESGTPRREPAIRRSRDSAHCPLSVGDRDATAARAQVRNERPSCRVRDMSRGSALRCNWCALATVGRFHLPIGAARPMLRARSSSRGWREIGPSLTKSGRSQAAVPSRSGAGHQSNSRRSTRTSQPSVLRFACEFC